MTRFRLHTRLIPLIALVFLASCAKRGTPSGGEKDSTPPVLLKAEPAVGTTSFKEKRIRLYFDEFIKFKKLQEQLIISPPLKFEPIIRPQGSASRMVDIQLLDTLLENTTYSINFGNALVDNNEENPYPFLQYVFATGDKIDSLSLKGAVRDAFLRKASPYITMMLYRNDTVYNDSLVYKEAPRYIGSTGDSLPVFNLNYLAPGSYKLFALEDSNKNNRYDPYLDKIGYLDKPISLPSDSLYLVELFRERIKFEAVRPKLNGSNHILIPYNSDLDSPPSVEVLNPSDSLWTYSEKMAEKDSLRLWFKPSTFDSIQLLIRSEVSLDTFVVKPVSVSKDTLTLRSAIQGAIPPRQQFKLAASTPIKTIDKSLIQLFKKDSIALSTEAIALDPNDKLSLVIDIEPELDTPFRLNLLPGAILDHFENTNDTLSFPFRYDSQENYGTLHFILETKVPVSSPIQVILLDKDDKSLYSQTLDSNQSCTFLTVKPGIYEIQLLFDQNGNKRYDTGSYLERIKPERIIYLNEKIEIRANWEERTTYRLAN
ncbi:MAG: Ig-like domain-containing protein [Bacteroidetes bacterium]|nr:Ig-like domain-containing protein [Bacteroidota bacterium]